MSGVSKNTDVVLQCELCPRETGIVLKLGALRDKIPSLADLKEPRYQHGICPTCKAELESGCTFFRDASGRCFKVSLEATREKISDAYWGKVVQLPATAFNELIKVWMAGQPKNSESGNGDVTPAGA